MSERARLALMVIGPSRRERLIERYADRLRLRYGMRPQAARRYAADLVDDADPAAVLAVGQTWTIPDGVVLPGGDIFGLAPGTSYTIREVTGDGMAAVSGGLRLNRALFTRMVLTGWPDTYDVRDTVQPPRPPRPEPGDDPDTDDETDGGTFAPHHLGIIVRRRGSDGIPTGDGLPLLGFPYDPVNMRGGGPPSYVNALNIPAYLDRHLADYRAGWPDFHAQHNPREWVDYFDAVGECDVDVAVAAYLGWWLWQRARSDVVNEYGGTVADYDVAFSWAPHMADAVIDVAPYAHPEWTIPADHRLVRCAGQLSILEDT